jgi:FkbM family methyltransferase
MDKTLPLWKAVGHSVATLAWRTTQHFSYRTRSGIAAGLKRTGGFGFLPRAVSDEEKFYLSLRFTGKVVYDVGSFEGIFSLFAAREVGADGCLVVCEPNPECFRRTRENLALNQFKCRVILRNVALGASRGSADMWVPAGEHARSTLNQELAATYANNQERCDRIHVEIESLDNLIADGLPIPQFVKIDTEGHEYEVLLGAERTLRLNLPELFIEMHGTTRNSWIQNRQNVQRFVAERGYSVFDMYRKTITETDSASHLYCKCPM